MIGIVTNMVIKVLMSYTMVSGFGIWDLGFGCWVSVLGFGSLTRASLRRHQSDATSAWFLWIISGSKPTDKPMLLRPLQ